MLLCQQMKSEPACLTRCLCCYSGGGLESFLSSAVFYLVESTKRQVLEQKIPEQFSKRFSFSLLLHCGVGLIQPASYCLVAVFVPHPVSLSDHATTEEPISRYWAVICSPTQNLKTAFFHPLPASLLFPSLFSRWVNPLLSHEPRPMGLAVAI